ncbi:helix-turn-helix transcriptional regulator [Mitsuaria sp. GD03876]|uniref:AraC family transcriptional regulator n=1 Tax=Mitsuaria sp. GD03876 TaxID=2975399 RepID=UPI002448918D|nr:helix-turn-helix transcriptional regulator [Mitsuaria sp. GD03876]MDH0865040.1 helix-turn-helix transcriptional regulator [Mitsuaria sp. GD03876]
MSANNARRFEDFHDVAPASIAMEADYASGEVTPWHSHPRGQLLYAIEGVMLVDSAAGFWVIPPNRALWLPAGVRHSVRMSGTVRMRTAFIDAARIEGLPERTCVLNVSPLLRELMVAAVRVPIDHAASGRDGALMTLLVHEIRGASTLPLHLPMPTDPRLLAICEALAGKPSDPATAQDWAARLGVAAKTVHRLFQKETGMSFAQWREQARLLYALRRIAEGSRVIDIALDCGYASQSAFAAMFRRHFGAPPSSFYASGRGG